MALRVRFQHPTGSKLGYSIERLADGLLYDFSTSTFLATPATPIAPLPEDTGNFLGRYKVTLSPTPVSQFSDGDYVVTIHDLANQGVSIADVVAELGTTMHGGDDATMFPVTIFPAGTYQFVLGGLAGTITVPTSSLASPGVGTGGTIAGGNA